MVSLTTLPNPTHSREPRPQESRPQKQASLDRKAEKENSDQAPTDGYALHQVTNYFSKPLEQVCYYV